MRRAPTPTALAPAAATKIMKNRQQQQAAQRGSSSQFGALASYTVTKSMKNRQLPHLIALAVKWLVSNLVLVFCGFSKVATQMSTSWHCGLAISRKCLMYQSIA